MKSIKIEYYALFREQAGLSNEEIQTDAQNVDALYKELKSRHGFSMCSTQLRVAVNEEFKDWSSDLEDGDSIVFIPPVAGG
ncbi:MAG: MoaD/ThiS family protein [Pseudomonadota bacterium]